MIRFTRVDDNVIVSVEHGVFNDGRHFSLELKQSQDYQAELLRRALQDNLNKHLSELKKMYYNKGWKDAKAKKVAKRTSFWGGWKS